jgi:hypothetical protein
VVIANVGPVTRHTHATRMAGAGVAMAMAPKAGAAAIAATPAAMVTAGAVLSRLWCLWLVGPLIHLGFSE